MARHYNKSFDLILNDWADWVHRGGNSGGFQSVLYKMMATGWATSGGGGGSSPEIHTIEADIEAALALLISTKPKDLNLIRVNVLRYEYGAKSLGWKVDARQDEKAHRMGVSLRTYKRHLKHCKDHLLITLKLNYKGRSHEI
jgi:predicted DNA-binding protein (UPF0251 family)